MSAAVRRAIALGATFLLPIGVVRPLSAHPLHTTLTEIGIDPRDGSARLTIRAFADDLSDAAYRYISETGTGGPRPALAEAIRRYVLAKVRVGHHAAPHLPIVWEGLRLQGDALFITLRVPEARTLRGVRIESSLLLERFPDQVNIVQAAVDGRRRSLIITRETDGGPQVQF